MKRIFFILLSAIWLTPIGASAASGGPIVFVPLDDRPVTYQLPIMLGQIAGVEVVAPPKAIIGHYLQAGDPERILSWLQSPASAGAAALVASTDMIAYGGLVNSRIYGDVPNYVAYSRLRRLAALRAERPGAWFAAFATIMRLAPTGVPGTGPTANFFAAGRTGELLQYWANLPQDSNDPEVIRKAASLRSQIGEGVINEYVRTRRRNLDVDLFLLDLTTEGAFDRVVLGQDDAGTQGLHVSDVRALREQYAREHLGPRASIEPGADELGMALVGAALARAVRWTPAIALHYSRADGPSYNDPLEFEPISGTIGSLVALCGGRQVESDADIDVFVRVPNTGDADEASFHAAIAAALAANKNLAVIDLSFLHERSDEDARTTAWLIASGNAGKLDAFASWNTTANSTGTALAEAIAVGAGRRAHTFNARAHAQFMLDRYVDDYAFHIFVRPELNARLAAAGVIDHTYLSGPIVTTTESENRSLLWRQGLALLHAIYPEYHDAGLTITLPWNRTFETEIDIRLAS